MRFYAKLLPVFSLFLVSSLSFAQSPSKTQKINRLIQIGNESKTIEKMMTVFTNGFKDLAKQRNVKDRAKYDAYINYVSTECTEVANRLMKKQLPLIYNKYFTEQELDEMIRFQLSPLGKKMAQTMPLIQADISKEILTTEYPQLKLKLDKKLSEIVTN